MDAIFLACFTRRRSQVRVLSRPPFPLFSWTSSTPPPSPYTYLSACPSRYEWCSFEVFRLWQFAHLTSHFSISALSAVISFFWYMMVVTCAVLCPRTWSNSKTTGSVSPQSTQGWPAKYSITTAWSLPNRALLDRSRIRRYPGRALFLIVLQILQ